MKSTTVHCISCGCKLKKDDFVHGAVLCYTTGNYGSTVFDPVGDSSQFLQFYLCDECLKKKSNIINHLTSKTETSVVSTKTFKKYLKDEEIDFKTFARKAKKLRAKIEKDET
jgi:hypothetical protein